MNSPFENPERTPVPATEGFLSPDAWVSHRDSGIAPRFVSSLTGSEAARVGFLWGAAALGLGSERRPLHPQQLVLADALNATDDEGRPAFAMMGVLLPRRSSKTTTVVANALGRCYSRPGWLVGFTLATTGDKARARFRGDIVAPLERQYPDPDNRPFRIRKAAGSEGVFFENGSAFMVLTPSSEAFRSEAFDEVIIDEAGEASPARSDDLLTGALATMDTRPDAQFVIAGTAPAYRSGNLLWDTLEDGRKGSRRTGIVEYSAPDTVTADDLAEWETTQPLVRAAHPGIGTLTTIDVIRDRWERLKPEQFQREYLSIAGSAGAVAGVLDWGKWEAAGRGGSLPTPPQHFALAFAVHPSQASAALVAAWRDGPTGHVLVLDHRPGVRWLADVAADLSRRYRLPLVHDSHGMAQVEVEELQRMTPRPRLAPQTTRNVTTAAGVLAKDLEDGRLVHYQQDALDGAVRIARKRNILGGWGFGRPTEEADITALEAAALALRYYDENPRRASNQVIVG